MLYKSICHFRGVRSIEWLLLDFSWLSLVANTVDPDQTLHYVASDLRLHCLLTTLFGFPGKNRLMHRVHPFLPGNP